MTITTTQTVADLRAAANEIRDRGWIRGDYINDYGCVCTAGAIMLVVGGEEYARATEATGASYFRYAAAFDAVNEHLHGTGQSRPSQDVIGWNDGVCQSGDQAAAALDAAADALAGTETDRG